MTENEHELQETYPGQPNVAPTDELGETEPQMLEKSSQESNVTTFSPRRKYFILAIVSLHGFLGPLSSSIYVPAIAQVRQTFDSTETVVNMTVSLYVFFQGLGPLVWATLSERFGRKPVYLASAAMYVAATIGCAVAPHIVFFIIVRVIQSIGSSASQAVGAGTIADIFEPERRGNAMGFFFLGALLGPCIAPVAGAYINEYAQWRSMFWLLTGLGCLTLALTVLFLPETRRAAVHAESGWTVMLRPIKLLFQPVVFLGSLPLGLAYGFMYFMIASLPYLLVHHYSLTKIKVGLAYLPNGIGNALGALISGVASDRYMDVKRAATGVIDPVQRLTVVWLGILALVMGEILYGWAVQYSITMALVMIGLFLFGLGVGFIQSPTNTYLVDIFASSSASAISACNLLRCTLAGITPLLAPTMISAMGNGWSLTLLAGITLFSGICVVVLQKHLVEPKPV
ncbi:major facilitator superfamily domain-containing protein [Gongronella butleri]|nr:major facilitator superfamily domain-containing protein [Gongronella butleri]